MVRYNKALTANIIAASQNPNISRSNKRPFWMVTKGNQILTKTIDNQYELFQVHNSDESSVSFTSISTGSLAPNFSIVDLCVESNSLLCIKDSSELVLKSIETAQDIFTLKGRGIISSVSSHGDYIAIGKMNGSISVVNWKTNIRNKIRNLTTEKISAIRFIGSDKLLAILQDWNYAVLKYTENSLEIIPHSNGILQVPSLSAELEKIGLKLDVEKEIEQKTESSAYPTPPSHPQHLEVWPSTTPNSYIVISWYEERIQYSKLSLNDSTQGYIESRNISLTENVICKSAHPTALLLSQKSYLNSDSFLQSYPVDSGSQTNGDSETTALLNDILHAPEESSLGLATLLSTSVERDSMVMLFSNGDVSFMSLAYP
ncbi:hypothetical protein AYI69_g6554 [Smittium culicis]|uniref:Uncharacterized protein n=1 Tax=Smittium culicis TaxID=133412 RepID=A0A1R1XY66_9FUNG|nr:hypothetical protein AYI69_g6554 [Smittium culicis]